MDQRLSIITLGVADVQRARTFYEKGLGWTVSSSSNEHICFIQLNGIVLALYGRQALAEDACIPNTDPGFGGITLAYTARTKDEVDAVLEKAVQAGATLLKPAQMVFWGGYSGYVADLDGHPWEVAWNPHFAMDDQGNMLLPA